MRVQSIVLFLGAVLGLGCDERGDIVAGDTFAYVGFDEQDARLVQGQLRFDRVEADRVSGRWQLSSSRPRNEIGPQVGEGTFAGSIHNETGRATIALDLNPGIADDNVFLNGTLEGRRFDGRWGWSTLLGERRSGRFEALRE